MEHRTFHRILAAIIAVLIVLAGYGVYYVNDYHHAINVGNAIQSNPTVKVTDIEDGWLFDGPGTTTAMVFYPGAKVEASAYAPLMQETAASGIDCFLMKMPANLAIFGINRADVVRSDIAGYSYDHWYIAGHSLGGTMAANYISKHTDNWDGLILLASYPTDDLNKTTRTIRIRQQRRHTEPQKSRIRAAAHAEAILRTGDQGRQPCAVRQLWRAAGRWCGRYFR